MHINRLLGLPTLEHAIYNCPWEKQSVFRFIPHYSNDCPSALLMVIANRTFPVSLSSFIHPPVPPPPASRCSCVPESRSSFIFPVSRSSFVSRCSSLLFLFECRGRHLYSLCPGVPVVIFVPVVICVPVSRSVISH